MIFNSAKKQQIMDTWLTTADNKKLTFDEKCTLTCELCNITKNTLIQTLMTAEAVEYVIETVLRKDGLKIIQAVEKQHELMNSNNDKVALEATKQIIDRTSRIYELKHSKATESMSDRLKELIDDIATGNDGRKR